MASIGLVPYDQGMQNTTSLSSRSSLFGFGIFRGPRRVESSPAIATAAAFDIPATFTQEQAEWILALHKLAAHDRSRAIQILCDWTPARCSRAQATCIEALLDLDTRDLHATLADASPYLCGHRPFRIHSRRRLLLQQPTPSHAVV